MKKTLLALCFVILCISSIAQQPKPRVAVLDPTTSGIAMDDGTKLAVQELISATLVNTGGFVIIERSMIDKIIKEQSFQNSDLADNSQATEIGKLAGANKVVLSSVSLVGGRNMLSIKMIDVETAYIEKQKAKIISSSDLLDAVEPLTMELLGEQVEYVKQNTVFTQTQSSSEKQSVPSSKKSTSTENNQSNNEYNNDKQYQAVCSQVENGIKLVGSSTKEKTEKLFERGKLLREVSLDGGIISTLSENGVLTIHGNGAMIPFKKNKAFEAQLAQASAIIVDEGITIVCGLSGRDVKYVKLPNTLEAIEDECFGDCSNLIAINIPSNVNKIGAGAFKGCESIQMIILPENITVIPDDLFKNCKRLVDLHFSNKTTAIGKRALYGCESIRKLDLPNTVISVGEGCFENMTHLYSVHLSEKLAMLPADAFNDCKSLTKIQCPASICSIGQEAFVGCENLVEAYFFSENMSMMGKFCFGDCPSLRNIILYSYKPPVCDNAGIFDEDKEEKRACLERVTLTVHPYGISDYKKAKFWRDFNVITTINL